MRTKRSGAEKFGVAKHPGGEHLAVVGSTDDVFWNRSRGFAFLCSSRGGRQVSNPGSESSQAVLRAGIHFPTSFFF